MNSLAKTLAIQNPSAFSILTVYKYIYKIKWFFDQEGTYTMLQVLHLPYLNMKEIIKSTVLKNKEYIQNLI